MRLLIAVLMKVKGKSFVLLTFSAPQDIKKHHQNKVKVKGLGRKSSYLDGFSFFFFMVL